MSANRYDFVFQDNIRMGNDAQLLYVSSAKYSGDWHSTPHTHNCSEFFYVTGGTGQFFIEGSTFPVSSNDLIIVNPNVEHTEISLNANPLEYIVLGISGLELSVNDEQEDSYRIINFHNMHDKILFYIRTMLREIEHKEPGYEIICQNLMEVLVVHLTRQTNFSVTMAPIKKNSSRLCSMVRRCIDKHFKENIDLDTLARLTHSNKYYLVHAFSEEYGISPINYMIFKRIEEAKQLLRNDDYTLSDISRMLEFSSPSYFSQAFKKHVGMTPTQYRKSEDL